MNTTQTASTIDSTLNTARDSAANLSDRVTDAVTDRAQAVQARVDDLLTQAPTAINHAVKDAEAIARSSIERMRLASTQASEKIARASDRTVGYIKDEPVKAVLIAAAVGAVSAALIGWIARSRSSN